MELMLTTVDKMDSREIAAMTGKDHKNVMRDIRSMLEEMDVDQLRFESVYKAGNGEERKCYMLPKRECLILASGYNVKLRASIIDRWAELEASASFATPKSFSEALRLAADQAQIIEDQTAIIESQKPAVEFVDRFVDAKQTQPLRAVAKILGVPEKKFVATLIERGVLYRLSGRLTPKQSHIDAGRFSVKEIVAASGYAAPQMSFTPKGVEWVVGFLGLTK